MTMNLLSVLGRAQVHENTVNKWHLYFHYMYVFTIYRYLIHNEDRCSTVPSTKTLAPTVRTVMKFMDIRYVLTCKWCVESV